MEIPFLKYEVNNHLKIKNLILNDIKNMGTYSLIDNSQHISNSDWHLHKNTLRPYIEHLDPHIDSICNNIKTYFDYKEEVVLDNFWFQQYGPGDYHLFHAHGKSTFSCVYYVNLESDSPKTTFKLNTKEFDVDVKEGEVLIFPGFLPHTSKKNNSNQVKTVIAFNLTI
jgi:hypothetical protein